MLAWAAMQDLGLWQANRGIHFSNKNETWHCSCRSALPDLTSSLHPGIPKHTYEIFQYGKTLGTLRSPQRLVF